MIETDELIADLQRVSSVLGRPPSMSEYTELGEYSTSPYESRFGSWTEAREVAGLEGGPTRNQKISEDELINELQRLAEELDRVPAERHINQMAKYGRNTYRRRFGGWNEALEAAGLEPNRENATKRELIESLQNVAEELGHPPTIQEADQYTEWCKSTYKRRWESWTEAIAAAGLDETQVRQYNIPEDNLIDEIRTVSAKVERAPRKHEMDEYSQYSGVTYQKRFESWSKALEIAGFEPYKHPPVETECAYCGNSLERVHAIYEKSQRHFCSEKDCLSKWRSENRSGEDHPQYKSDKDRIPYGDNYEEMRQERLEYDDYQCVHCGMSREEHLSEYDSDLHMHHIKPRRSFYEDPNKTVEDSNTIGNLLTLCASHHKQWEGIPLKPQL